MKKKRIAVLNSHPIQYFAPLYAYLNEAPDLEVTALYMTDWSIRGRVDVQFGQVVKWDIDLLSGYPSIFLGEAAKTRDVGTSFWSLWAPQVWHAVRSGGYDALWLPGHQFAAHLIALAAAKSIGLPVLVRGETHLGLPRFGLKQWLRRPVMGFFYALCDRCLAIGTENANFYRAMGVPGEKIVLVPYVVDNERFIRGSSLTQPQRDAVRMQFGIPPDEPAILYAAKFARRKHPDDLLAAALRVRESSAKKFTVVMCGSGEMEGELRAYCESHDLKNVVFTGFVNQATLPKLYGACDAFVLPAEVEPWGLVVNEAMCAALPVVVSREVGCVTDLVSDGVNGFAPNSGDVEGFAEALRKLIEDPDLRKAMGAASRDRISHWSFHECLTGIRAALGHG